MFSNRDLLHLFLPLILEQLLAFMVGLSDSLMAASIEEAAVSGISLVDQVMALIISLFTALAAGGTIVMAQYWGSSETECAKDTANQLIRVAGVAGICVMMFIYLMHDVILYKFFGDMTQAVFAHANIYFLIVAASVPFIALYHAGAAVFRTVGNTKLPMLIMLSMNLLNVAGNIIFVLVLHLGTAGIAIPTLVSRMGAALLIIAFAMHSGQSLQLECKRMLQSNSALIYQILRIGIPYGLENGMFYFGKLLVLSLVSTFGTAAIAANAVGGTICSFEALPGMAIGMGFSVVIAQCVGANDYGQLRYYTRKIMTVIYMVQLLTAIVVLTILPMVLRMYNLSADAARWTSQIAWSHAVVMVLIWPLGNALSAVFRAAGDAKFPMVISSMTMCICRVALAYLLVYVFGMNMLATWLAIYCDWFIKGAIFIWRYRQQFSNTKHAGF